MTSYPLLDTINSPVQLRELDRDRLPQLAEELRTFLVESVSRTGGSSGTSPCILAMPTRMI